MATDIVRIRDQFLDKVRELGYRIDEKSPARGYTFSADIYVGTEHAGRLLVRKTTVSWKAKNAPKLKRLTDAKSIDDILPLKIGSIAEGKAKPARPKKDDPVEPKKTKPVEPKKGKRVEPKKTKPTGPSKAKPKAKDKATLGKRPKKKVPEAEPSKKIEPEGEPSEVSDSMEPPPVAVSAETPKLPIADKPLSTPVRENLGKAMALFKEGNFEKAIEWAKVALAENPDSVAAKDILARAEKLLAPTEEKAPEEEESPKREIPAVPETKSGKHELIAGMKEKSPPTAAPKHPPSPHPSQPSQTEPDQKQVVARPEEQAKRRISPWVVIAFIALIIAVVVLKPRPERATQSTPLMSKQTPPDTTANPLVLLREKLTVLEAELDQDTLGLPATQLIDVIGRIAESDPSDTTLAPRLRTLALRADSLAFKMRQENSFSFAAAFLEEALDSWSLLSRSSPEDSTILHQIALNKQAKELLGLRRAMFANMVHVPADTFTRGFGRADFDARPVAKIVMDGYYVDKSEVTNLQYQTFVLDTETNGPSDSRRACRAYSWSGTDYPEGKGDYPVVLTTWEEALRFAKWIGKSLPSEAQWEKAARSGDGRHYPWGNDFDKSLLVSAESKRGLSEVGSTPGDVSPYGAMDMAGNTREWTNDWYSPDYYRKSPKTDPQGPRRGREKVIRGGSWKEEGLVAGLTFRRAFESPSNRAVDIGFRLVVPDSLYPEELKR